MTSHNFEQFLSPVRPPPIIKLFITEAFAHHFRSQTGIRNYVRGLCLGSRVLDDFIIYSIFKMSLSISVTFCKIQLNGLAYLACYEYACSCIDVVCLPQSSKMNLRFASERTSIYLRHDYILLLVGYSFILGSQKVDFFGYLRRNSNLAQK
jgi:hypothetical protein